MPELLIRNYIPINTALFHHTLPKEAGGFSHELDLLEDWNLWLRFAVHTGQFAHAPKTTAVYRVPHSKSERKYRRRKFREQYERALEENLTQLETLNTKLEKDFAKLDLKDRLFIKLIGWLGERELLGFRSRYPLLVLMTATKTITKIISRLTGR